MKLYLYSEIINQELNPLLVSTRKMNTMKELERTEDFSFKDHQLLKELIAKESQGKLELLVREVNITKNRYWLFAGIEYYPLGGMHDLVWADDDAQMLKNIVSQNQLFAMKLPRTCWAHILDTETGITEQINLR